MCTCIRLTNLSSIQKILVILHLIELFFFGRNLSYITVGKIFLFSNWHVAALVTSSLVALKHLNTP